MPSEQQAETNQIVWTHKGAPISLQFDDPYFSMNNGLEETRHVFLTGNGLPERLQDGFHIAELGFGTGLNMFATLDMWHHHGTTGTLYFTSFEAFPLSTGEIARALSAFPEITPLIGPFLAQWQKGQRKITLPGLEFEMIKGDARKTLPSWEGRADAWFLDGFSPAKNPELWETSLMGHVYSYTQPNGTFATYTAAGHIRRSLSDAGFHVMRCNGYGHKRHMSLGIKSEPLDRYNNQEQEAI